MCMLYIATNANEYRWQWIAYVSEITEYAIYIVIIRNVLLMPRNMLSMVSMVWNLISMRRIKDFLS